MPVTTRITADGAFLLGCEDNPAALVVIPLDDPAKGRSFDLGIGATDRFSGYLTLCRIEESPDGGYASVWVKSSEGEEKGSLYRLSDPPSLKWSFHDYHDFFLGSRFVEIDGTSSVRVCDLAKTESDCDREQVPKPVTQVLRGRMPGITFVPLQIAKSLSVACFDKNCVIRPPDFFLQGSAPAPESDLSSYFNLYASEAVGTHPKALAIRSLANSDMVGVTADGGIWRLRDSLLDHCCKLEVGEGKIIGFAAGGNRVAAVAEASGEGKEKGIFLDTFLNEKRTDRLALQQMSTVDSILCSRSGRVIVVSGGEKAVILNLRHGIPERRAVDLPCRLPTAIDESDAWIACAGPTVGGFEALNIENGKIIKLDRPSAPIDKIFIGSGLVTSAGLYKEGPHSGELHLASWRLPSGDRLSQMDCPLSDPPERIYFSAGGTRVVVKGSSLEVVNTSSCEARKFGVAFGGWTQRLAVGDLVDASGFADVAIAVRQGPILINGSEVPNIAILNLKQGGIVATIPAGGHLSKVSIAPDGQAVLVETSSGVAAFPLGAEEIAELISRQMGGDFNLHR
jgi:hypothetical protein